MKGFFTKKTEQEKQLESKYSCESCGLWKSCKSPKIKVSRDGAKKILIISEVVGKHDDEKNDHLVGDVGNLLRSHFRRQGLNIDKDCWKICAVNCHTPNSRKSLETPEQPSGYRSPHP